MKISFELISLQIPWHMHVFSEDILGYSEYYDGDVTDCLYTKHGNLQKGVQ
jgi:hypothetical protein